MAAVALTYRATMYDLLNRTTQQVLLEGEATLTGLGVGGGPIIPPDVPKPPIDPGLHPEHPIYLPPSVPPGLQPPPVSPGDPTTPVPPPAGQPGWPVTPMVPPSYVIINYPGVGPVYVAPPAPAAPPSTP